FDEPTAGLDPDARHDLWQIVRDVRDSGATVVLTTHYMEEAEALCDRVAMMNAGEIAALDTPPGLVRGLQAPYRVRIATSAPVPADAVRALPGATEVAQSAVGDVHVTELRAQDAPAVTLALARLASDGGAAIVDLAVLPATLEDAFLAMTGRGLSG
ncbi:MAG: ABC transporter ATP-binding protein, partial [Dehalococcoidia bacterium]